jgi:hypothetical protein
MEINFSRIIGILSFIVTGITLVLGVATAFIPADIATLLLGITAAISAFSARVQGTVGK